MVYPSSALAVCPVCTVTIGACVGLSRLLGVDDLISGTFIGGLTLSLGFWFFSWLQKKKINFPFRKAVAIIVSFMATVLPLYFKKFFGHPGNTFWGIDKLLLGIIAGSIAFLVAQLIETILRRRNQGKAYFPYQKVIIPLVILLLTSGIFYFIACR